MVRLAQLVRASDCGSEGRGFDPHTSPQKEIPNFITKFGGSFSFISETYSATIRALPNTA